MARGPVTSWASRVAAPPPETPAASAPCAPCAPPGARLARPPRKARNAPSAAATDFPRPRRPRLRGPRGLRLCTPVIPSPGRRGSGSEQQSPAVSRSPSPSLPTLLLPSCAGPRRGLGRA